MLNIRKIAGYIVLMVTTVIDPSYGQTNITVTDGYNVFYYPNGQVASEGYMRSGKPDGYWKTYYVTGIIKSEGNRKNFLLDSIWVFYNPAGDTLEKISYMYGKKNGYSYTYDYQNKGITSKYYNIIARELYVNDKKEGKSFYYYPNGGMKEVVHYINGKREGISKEFDNKGNPVTLLEYHNDILIDRQRINRRDEKGMKQGRWVTYYDDDRIYIDAFYKDDMLDGQYIEYDASGKMRLSMKYVAGIIREEPAESNYEVDIRNEYHNNGVIRYSGAYRGSTKIGIHRQYDEQGKVVASIIYDNAGKIVSQGIVNERGEKVGPWIDYYETGEKKNEGFYSENRKSGEWKFFNTLGKVVQTGEYRNGLENGVWKWYYPDGKLWREEEYFNGKEDGPATEYSPEGEIIASGGYLEGEKEGEWLYRVGDHTEKGSYTVGIREGIWRYYANENIRIYEGNYSQGNPDGKHVYYYENGNVMEERFYNKGIRERNWKKYDPEGNVLITITYKNDQEYRINGMKIRLPTPGVTRIR